MATAILRSHDCHKLRFHPESLTSSISSFHPRRNSNSDRSRRRKRSPVGLVDTPSGDRNRDGSSMVVKFPAKNLVMEHVTILKRGEEMKVEDRRRQGGARNGRTVRFENEEDSVLCSTDRLGPEPEMVQKQIRVKEFKVVDGSLYAGSVSFASPPPSSLPFPAFFAKNDAATTDLRRLLRIDLI